MAQILLYCLLLLDIVLPLSNGTIHLGQPDLATLGRIAEGRALLLVLKEGMTEEQVKHLLGRSGMESWFGASCIEADYSRYGLSVWYSRPRKLLDRCDQEVRIWRPQVGFPTP